MDLTEKSQKGVQKTVQTISESQWSSFRIRKNILVISSGIFLLFTSYQGLANLQSTMNSSGGMGTAAQATIYAVVCLSSMFLPKFTIKKLGLKTTIVLSLLAYCPYIASNFYATWATLIPSAILLGLGSSLFWAANCTYLNKLAVHYKKHKDQETVESITAWLFGISGTSYLSSFVSGNLISYLVLQHRNEPNTNETYGLCGSKFCDGESVYTNNTNLKAPSKELRDILTGIFLTSGILSVILLATIMDSLPEEQDKETTTSLKERLMATFMAMKRKNMLLLMPLTLYLGMGEAFYISDVTRAYIACTWGVQHIGLVTVCEGVVSAFSSVTSGGLRKYIGRIPMFVTAAVINILVFIQLFTWTPNPGTPFWFFVLAALWGAFNGIYVAQLRAYYGLLFRGEEETAFANYYLFAAIGHCISFSYSKYLCTSTKLYILVSMFCLSQASYAVTEHGIRNSEKTLKQTTAKAGELKFPKHC